MKNKSKQKETTFLTKDENEELFSILGKNRFTLSTTLARILLSDPPKHMNWQLWCTGIACLVKDYEMKTFYISVFDFVEQKMLWTQNMSEVFEHKSPQNLFFMFKGKEYSVGLQFVDESEAKHFTDLVRQLLDTKNELWRNSLDTRRGSFRKAFDKLFTRPSKSKKMTIVHQTHDKASTLTHDVIYTEVMVKPKSRPKTFETTIVNNIFKPIEKLHPPIPRRITRL